MKKTIKLPCYGIEIELGPVDTEAKTLCYQGGTITSTLKEDNRKSRYNAALDGLESMILSCACAGVDVEAPAFLVAIETTADAIDYNLG